MLTDSHVTASFASDVVVGSPSAPRITGVYRDLFFFLLVVTGILGRGVDPSGWGGMFWANYSDLFPPVGHPKWW